MKKLAFFLVMLAAVAAGQAQTTGTGIVLLTGSPYEFTPTTVDSTTTFEFQLVNTVGVQQIVYFGGLDAPFNVNPLIPTAVPANDTLDMELTFNPSEIGVFSDTLEVLGNVFGNADLVISGQGIQVILEWTPEELAFDTTAIGQQSSATLTITSSGDGAGTITDVVFSNDIFSLDEANSSLTIDEGTSGDLTFLFSPTGAGVFNETVDLHTNDPNNSVITLPLSAVGISEVSGEVCDVTWSLADSPFTLVGEVTVPDGCTLTIEPGVVIDTEGYQFEIFGDIACNADLSNPISINGGRIILGEGDYLNLSGLVHSDDGSVLYDSPYELVYYNNFETSDGQYDFNCFDEHNNYHVTGTADQYSSYGCDDFYRSSNSSWSLQKNSGDYYLRFFSGTGGNGYLYLESPPVANETGEYEFSFTYESDRYERNCFMTIDVLEEEEWITLYTSPTDIEGNSSHTRFGRARHFFEQGEVMNFRIRHHNGVNESYSNDMYTYIDEVRIERVRNTINEITWDFSNNQADIDQLIEDYGEYGGEPRISVNEGVMSLNAAQTTISFNTTGWSVAPIIVPEDGWYYIKLNNRLIDASYNTHNYFQYKSSLDNNSWYQIITNYEQYNSDYAPYTYDWREEIIHTVEYLSAGSRIDFNYYGYYWTTAGAINWEFADVSIFQLEEATSPSVGESSAGIISARNMEVSQSELNSLSIMGECTIQDVSASKVYLNGSGSLQNVTIADEAIIAADSLEIENSTIGSIESNSIFTSIVNSEVEQINVKESLEFPDQAGLSSAAATSNLIYYNNFEDLTMSYDFNCFDEHNNYDVTGTTDQYGSYGCNDFSRSADQSWSLQKNSGDGFLRFYSTTGGNGYLYLEELPVAPSSGNYEFSFTYESDRYERNCFMTVDVFSDNQWVTLYTSPVDIESNSQFTRFARAIHFFEEGEEMNFRIRHHNGVNETYSNEMFTYIDEVRIEKERSTTKEVVWDFDQNASDFEQLISDYGEYGGEPRISITDEELNLNAAASSITMNTSGWSVAPIIVPEDGWYYVSIESALHDASFHTYNYWYYKSTQDDNSWYHVTQNERQYSSDFAPYPYDWRQESVHSYQYLTAGSRIDFYYHGYPWTTAGAINSSAREFKIYQLTDELISGDFKTLVATSSSFGNIDIEASYEMNLSQCEVEGSPQSGISMSGAHSELSMEHCIIFQNQHSGIHVSSQSGQVSLHNVVLAENGGNGLYCTVPSSLDYVTIANNGGIAWANSQESEYGANSVHNSIFAMNGQINGYEDLINASDYAESSYSSFTQDPQFQEGSYMLEPYSPCVDAAMPWNTDQNMPFGMGGLRADMGAYGGPNNAGWGGSPAPDGAATLQAASDTPQDQGYVVGLTFDASAFDNSIISDNISHYAVWRHYDPTGESIASLDEGNWELLGTMPAQGFTGYAYQAEALGNTNAFGTFNSCYTVVAHTDNEDVYWYSNVMCGEAMDNLAPEDPELNGLVLESGGAQISWTPPTEEDYAYTEIFNDDGFTAEVGNDTLVVDVSALAGNTYTYTAVHYDVNGNASDPVSLTLDISAGLDVINLNAGWNLISIDRSLSDGDVEDLLSGLQPGNLQYVTGFQNGVQFYDPNGLSFLNTLGELDNGYGYWVKVTEDDVLEVGGASLPLNYRPQLTAGWNLIGYPNADDSDPADYFADLIAEDNLLYVTGFDQGSQVFDPNGLAFLNTLQELENGFGYWVKTVVSDDPNGMAPANTKSNPAYMVLNGSSQLNDAGGTVDVINALGEVVATMDILEGGYLMTTAVFGADPSDEAATGLQLGEELSFAYNGKLADQTITWEGGMEHRSLALTFSDAMEALTLSPNPAQAITQLTFELLSDASVIVQVSDATGRLVMDLSLGTLAEGAQQLTLGLSEFDAGVYEVSVVANGAVIGATRLLKQQ